MRRMSRDCRPPRCHAGRTLATILAFAAAAPTSAAGAWGSIGRARTAGTGAAIAPTPVALVEFGKCVHPWEAAATARAATGARTVNRMRDAKDARQADAMRSAPRLAEWLRALRAAELAADRDAIDALARDRAAWPTDPETREIAELLARRMSLAQRAVEPNASALAPAERRAAIRTLAAERLALADAANGVGGDLARLARTEWRLEAVEDLVLRAPAAGALDFAVAAAFLTAGERAELVAVAEEARNALAAVDRDHAKSPTPDPATTIATDPIAFRRAALDGLVACLESDLESDPESDPASRGLSGAADDRPPSANGRRTTARSLERASHASARLRLASRCELPLPRALGEILALAEARMIAARESSSADDRRRRADLLAVAARASDPALELLARIELWKDNPRRGPFPTPIAESRTLAILATLAEVRLARIDRSLDGAEATIRALLARTAAAERESAARAGQLAATAGLLAERLPRALASAAAAPSGSATTGGAAALAALAAARLGDAELAADRAGWPTTRLRAIALDPLVAPLVAVRAIGALAARGDAAEAAALLAATLDAIEALPNARALADLLLELRRAEAATGADGEIALDDALAIALRRFPSDPTAARWTLERVDLALLPRHTQPNAARAKTLLATVPRSDATRTAVELRSIEAAELALPARGRADLEPLRARAAKLRATIDAAGVGTTTPTDGRSQAAGREDPLGPANAGDLLARLSVVDARLALREGRPDEGRASAARALGRANLAEASILRACVAWAEALAADDGSSASSTPSTRAAGTAKPTTPAQSNGTTPPASAAPPAPDTVEPAVLAALRRTPAAATALESPLALAADRLDDARRAADAARSRAVAERHARPLAEAMLAARPASADATRTLAIADLALGRSTDAIARLEPAHAADPADRALALALADALATDGAADARARAFALYRELSPLAADATARDAPWWCAQLGQLEILAGDPARNAEILARLNRLAAIDASFGAAHFRSPGAARVTTLERRFDELRRRLANGG